MNTQARFLFGLFAIFGASFVHANTVALDTVTVAGTRSEISIKDNPASVSVLGRKQIEQQGADSVAELLRDIPGVTIADSSAAGMKRIRMRGESSRRVTILVDGQEITDHSTFGTPILINPANIESIEVIRGPASVLYGAKAIGGVINILTRQGGGAALELEVGATWHSASAGRQGFASLSGAQGRFDYRLSVAGEAHDDRTVADGPYSSSEQLDSTSFDNTDINLHLGYRLGAAQNHYVMVKANHYALSTESWTDPAVLTYPIEEFRIDLPKRDLSKVGLYYEGKDLGAWVKRVQSDLYYQWVDREFSNHLLMRPLPGTEVKVASTSIDRNINYGGSAQVDLNVHEDHQLIGGVQYLLDELTADKTSDQFVNGAPYANEINNNTASMQTLSVFLQDTWALPRNVHLLAGARAYQVSTALDHTNDPNRTHAQDSDNHQAVKSLGLTYTGMEAATLRLLYSEGYIMPTLLQMYTDTSAGRGVTTYGNPTLSPETSQNIEFGLRFAHQGWMLDVASFYTQAEDYITSSSCNPLSLCPAGATTAEFIHLNADGATSFGLEFQIEHHFVDWMLTPYASGTWMRRELTLANFSTYHSDTPLFTGRAGARYEQYVAGSELWLDIFMRGASESSYQASASSSVDTLAGYATAHVALGGALGMTNQYQWSLQLNNLLDKSYRASKDELPGVGRSLVASLSAKF